MAFLTRGALAVLVSLAGFAQAGAWERARERLQERSAEHREQRAERGERVAHGTHTFTLVHEGRQRQYLVHVPRSYSGRDHLPVLFAFHGGGGNAKMMADDPLYGIVDKSEEVGFIAVFPNGYSRFPSGILATHNAGNCCGEARDRNVDDVGFVREIVKQVKQRYRTDSSRYFAAGMSNGAMMAYRLACEMSDTFRAIAAVAGTDNTSSCTPSRPVSVLHVHALNDTHVLFNGGAGEHAFRDVSKVAEFTSVPETVRRWVSRNQCRGAPQPVLAVQGARCERYGSCSAAAMVQLCVTDAGGHSWPGAARVARQGKEPASQAIDANDVMWKFFAAAAVH